MKLSKAAERVLRGCAEFAVTNQFLPPSCMDYRVLPMLVERGLVGTNLRHGYCLSPAGQKLLATLATREDDFSNDPFPRAKQ